jgi:hypothetical protein
MSGPPAAVGRKVNPPAPHQRLWAWRQGRGSPPIAIGTGKQRSIDRSGDPPAPQPGNHSPDPNGNLNTEYVNARPPNVRPEGHLYAFLPNSPCFAQICIPPARLILFSVHSQQDFFAHLQAIALFVPLQPDKSVYPQPNFFPPPGSRQRATDNCSLFTVHCRAIIEPRRSPA